MGDVRAGLVDHYFGINAEICRKYPNCRTDRGAMQRMRLEKRDLTQDMNHLTVSGQHKMVAIAVQALYG